MEEPEEHVRGYFPALISIQSMETVAGKIWKSIME
jgi:hypothetical protein